MKRRVACVPCSLQAIGEILVPTGRILAARLSFDPASGDQVVEFFVEHPDLDEIEEGMIAPTRPLLFGVFLSPFLGFK